jgi:hypothetical protein
MGASEMHRVKLIKWDDDECKSRGWEGGMQELSQDTGLTVDELQSYWWVDDESAEQVVAPSLGKLEEIIGHVIIRDRVYPTTVSAVVVSRTDKEMVIEVPDVDAFF